MRIRIAAVTAYFVSEAFSPDKFIEEFSRRRIGHDVFCGRGNRERGRTNLARVTAI